MSTPKVTFRQGNPFRGDERLVTYVASRPEVLPLLKEITECHWGWCVDFHGTEAELIAAAIARADMFDIGKSVQRIYDDEFGDRCIVYRRGKKAWDVNYEMNNGTSDALPTDERPGKCPWWIKWCAETEAATAEILKRFARPAARP